MGETMGQPLALVTGAAQRIGQAVALRLAQRGYAIGLHYHRSEALARKTADEIQGMGVPVLLLRGDLRRAADIHKIFAAVDETDFSLRVLVNSAAVMEAGDLRTLSAETWDDTLDLNLRAPWLCAQEAARRMTDGGVMINFTDSGAHKTWSGFPAYAVSKAGLEALTRLLARTLAPGIRVNAVAPGLILKAADVPEEAWQALVKRVPMQRQGDVTQLTQAVEFILDNDYLTGQTIVIDGGYQLI